MKKLIILMLTAMILCGSSTIQAENKTRTAQNAEQVTNQQADKNPIVGTDKKGRTIHQGSRGGLYYWTTYKKGEKAGQVKKAYLTKAEKEEFYKSHPNVKRPTNN